MSAYAIEVQRWQRSVAACQLEGIQPLSPHGLRAAVLMGILAIASASCDSGAPVGTVAGISREAQLALDKRCSRSIVFDELALVVPLASGRWLRDDGMLDDIEGHARSFAREFAVDEEQVTWKDERPRCAAFFCVDVDDGDRLAVISSLESDDPFVVRIRHVHEKYHALEWACRIELPWRVQELDLFELRMDEIKYRGVEGDTC